MKVSELMTRDVRIASPDDSLKQAAKLMAEIDAGVLPVGDKDRLVGMLTDRDIAIKGVAQGKGPDTKVRDVMTADVKYCFEDDDVEDVSQNMGDLQIRRLPVVNRDKRLVGIVSLGDLAVSAEADEAGEALTQISQPSGGRARSA